MARRCSALAVHTVCAEAGCPNWAGCFKERKITFMILGRACSRGCRFCKVEKSPRLSLPVDQGEPDRIASAVKDLAMGYAVVTSVSRDDLADGGAQGFARTIRAVRALNKDVKIEVLVPDFQGEVNSLRCVLEAGPDVLAHNLETVPRLHMQLRPQADYRRSLRLLDNAKKLKPGVPTKSSLMLGLGEEKNEVIDAMRDLKDNNCDCLTLGQYLSPSAQHYPVKRFISPDEFREYAKAALEMGFKSVLSGPKVRSSYQAQRLYQCMN